MRPILVWLLMGILLLGVGSGAVAAPRSAGQAEVAAAVYAAGATQAAALRSLDAQFQREREKIEELAERAQRGEAKARAELVEAQERYVAQLAERDATYAREIAVFRSAVEDIAATSEGAALLAQRRPGNLAQVRRLLTQLAEDRRSAELRTLDVRYAVDLRAIARITVDDCQLGEASTEEAIRRFEDVMSRDATNTADWLQLAILYREVGDPEKAAAAAGQGLRLKAEPATIASLHIERGRSLADSGRIAEARAALESGVAALRGVDDRYSRETLIAALYRLSDLLYLRMGEIDSARKVLEEALVIARAMLAQDPSSLALQRQMGITLQKIGEIELASQNYTPARQHFDEALMIARALTDNNQTTDRARLRRELSVAINKVGDLSVELGDLSGALKAYDDSLVIRRALYNDDSTSAVFQRDVAIALYKISQIRVVQEDGPGAKQLATEAVELMRGLVARSPTNRSFQNYLGFMLIAAADAATRLRDYEDARAYVDEAVSLLQPASPSAETTMTSRDVWLARLRLNFIPGSGVNWRTLEPQLESVLALGDLSAADRYLIAEARR